MDVFRELGHPNLLIEIDRNNTAAVGLSVQPLAIVVVGGMLIGTLIILLVMPLLFRFVQVKKSTRSH